MSEIKVYGLDSSLIYDADPKDGFVVDVVRFSDYVELERKYQAVVAEGAALRSGKTYFSYGFDSGYEEHPTAEKAQEAAEADIDYYRGDACDGWSDEVDQVVWGVVIERSTQTNLRKRTEEDSCDKSIDEICDYVLLPEVETPATTQAINEIKAQGVDAFAVFLKEQAKESLNRGDDYVADRLNAQSVTAIRFAASLRGGE